MTIADEVDSQLTQAASFTKVGGTAAGLAANLRSLASLPALAVESIRLQLSDCR
jgi:hypothetical protein